MQAIAPESLFWNNLLTCFLVKGALIVQGSLPNYFWHSTLQSSSCSQSLIIKRTGIWTQSNITRNVTLLPKWPTAACQAELTFSYANWFTSKGPASESPNAFLLLSLVGKQNLGITYQVPELFCIILLFSFQGQAI